MRFETQFAARFIYYKTGTRRAFGRLGENGVIGFFNERTIQLEIIFHLNRHVVRCKKFVVGNVKNTGSAFLRDKPADHGKILSQRWRPELIVYYLDRFFGFEAVFNPKYNVGPAIIVGGTVNQNRARNGPW